MKKITLLLSFVAISCSVMHSQTTVFVEAPLFDNSTTGTRAPNGTAGHAFMRGCALVLQSELTGIPTGSNITSFGFTLTTGTNLTAVSGNFTVYLQNTSDVTYLKGTNYATAITGMTNVYASVMTVPTTATSSSITVTLSTPFTYTGGGLYVAYDWASAGPFDATAAIYRANSLGLIPGCATAASGVSAPTTLATTAFRPCFLFGIANTYTNDVQVLGIEAPGKVAGMFNTPHTIKALIKNGSNGTLNNIGVNLNVTGANPTTSGLSISSLASGATTLVSFPAVNPMIAGVNTISVSVAADENNLNNSFTYNQNVMCNEWAQNPTSLSYTNAVGFNTASGIIANLFNNPIPSVLTGIRGAISTNTPSVGQQIYAVLLTAGGSIIATTNTVTITNLMLGTFESFTFSSPQNLSASTSYYLGFAQTIGTVGYFPAGALTTSFLPPNLYATTGLTGGVMTPLTTNLGYFGIEAVFAPNVISAQLTPTAMCSGSTATITTQGIATSYTWNPVAAPNSSITISPSVNSTYTVTGELPSLMCSSMATISISIIQPPVLNMIPSSTAICLGQSATITTNGANTYSWNTGATTNTITDNPLINTTYTVEGTSSFGCVATKTLEIIVNSFTPGITSSTAICLGNQINITATGGTGTSYTWSTGFNGFANITVSPTLTTGYTITTIGANGCKGSNSSTITVNPNPTITAVAQRTFMCKGETNTLTVSGAATYSWSNGSTSTSSVVIITPQTNINFSVTGTSVDGCSAGTQISLNLSTCSGLAEQKSLTSPASVFPNPSNGSYTVQLNSIGASSLIEIRNALGSIIFKQAVTEFETKLDLQNQPNGVYFLQIQEKDKTVYNTRIIKN